MATTVHVKNISPQTSEKEVREFFSFCGKISSISVTPAGDSQSAAVTFEKPTAAKTALLLDNTQLGPALVQVTGAASLEETSKSATGSDTSHSAGNTSMTDLEQEDKPRSRIVAEYLAHGYSISDKAIQNAIALDNQHGISARFTAALQSFDQKLHATEKAQQVDEKYGVTERANATLSSLSSYFEKAMGTPTGQKIHEFYSGANKQVMDVHTEARRLANLRSSHIENIPGTDKTKCGCAGSTENCPCEPGRCACANCPKNADHQSSSDLKEKMGMETVSGTNKTRCNCGGDTGTCPCEPGKCACANCGKN